MPFKSVFISEHNKTDLLLKETGSYYSDLNSSVQKLITGSIMSLFNKEKCSRRLCNTPQGQTVQCSCSTQ